MTNKTKNPLKHPEQRVGVFIDVQNLYYSAKNLFGKKVDFGAIVKEAVGDRKLIRAIAYVVRTESKEEQPFFEALYNLGIETKEKDLQIFSTGMKKADWDVGLTVDAIRLAPSLDAIVIASGDGDYIPLVAYLQKSSGKQVEVLAFGDTTSSKLIEEVDDFIDMSEDKQKFLIGDRMPIRRTSQRPPSRPAPRTAQRTAKPVRAVRSAGPVKPVRKTVKKYVPPTIKRSI
jgi:uncharacterized LabA/DUF88 family protein